VVLFYLFIFIFTHFTGAGRCGGDFILFIRFCFLHITLALDEGATVLFFHLLLIFTHCTGAGRRGGAGACN
jgi:hypothetical protein